MKVYAVRRGRTVGLFDDWPACEAQVRGFSGAEFKGFESRAQAQVWLDGAQRRQPAGPPSVSIYTDGRSRCAGPALCTVRPRPHRGKVLGYGSWHCIRRSSSTATRSAVSSARSLRRSLAERETRHDPIKEIT